MRQILMQVVKEQHQQSPLRVAPPGEAGTTWRYTLRPLRGTVVTEAFEWHWTPVPNEGFRGRIGRLSLDEAMHLVAKRHLHLQGEVDAGRAITADRRSQPRAGIEQSVRSQTSVESEECVLVVEGEVRPLTADDVPWMVEMMASRRALYETFSPVFWKPSPNAREVHRPYLASCVTSDRHCGFRTDDAFHPW